MTQTSTLAKISLLKSLAAPLAVALLFSAPLAWPDQATEKRIRLLGKLIADNPNDQAAIIQQAIAYSDNQQPDLALSTLETARTAGDPVNTAFARGIILYRSRQFQAAEDSLNLFLERYPRHTGALEYRARVLRDNKKFDAALRDFEQLFRLNDTANPGHYLSVADMIRQLPNGGDDAALGLLDERMSRVGVLTTLQRYAIGIERDRGNYRAAIDRLSTLDEALRATPQWKVEVAKLSIQSGQVQEALPLLQVALGQLEELRPNGARRQLKNEIELVLEQLNTANQ